MALVCETSANESQICLCAASLQMLSIWAIVLHRVRFQMQFHAAKILPEPASICGFSSRNEWNHVSEYKYLY